MARIGAHDLEETVDGFNLAAWIGFLRKGILYRELNGEPVTRKTLLKAQASLNVKAIAFHKENFAEKIVQIHACDFRQDLTRANRRGLPSARTRSCPFAMSARGSRRWLSTWTS